MNIYETTSEAYMDTLRKVWECPDYICEPRGKETHECMNYMFKVLRPTPDPIVTKCPERNQVIAKYTEAEFELYAKGERQASEFAKMAPFWLNVANPDGTVNSAYGYKVWYDKNTPEGKTQWEWCKERLLADLYSRQAVMFFGTPASQYEGNKDQACTLSGTFLIRGGRLHLSMVMRSNDVVRGLAYDMPWFCLLLREMAKEVNRLVGSYTHFAHSMHIYTSTKARVQAMLGEK